jgi:hypothetical protein
LSICRFKPVCPFFCTQRPDLDAYLIDFFPVPSRQSSLFTSHATDGLIGIFFALIFAGYESSG